MTDKISWIEEVQKRKDAILQDTQRFLKIKSVLDETTSAEGAPFGNEIRKALEFMLNKGEEDGFTVKNLQGFAGHIEYGKGRELIGVLCHVDVVPEGDGWSSDPYSAEIRDNRIFARGALDDKGPTIAAYYALKIVKELGLEINKRVRIILGTDEESNWRCVDHYFKHEEMPTMGFAPDADFPIIHAEKGIFDFKLEQIIQADTSQPSIVLNSFEAGRRLNMVPDFAKASLICGQNEMMPLYNRFQAYLSANQLTGEAQIEGNSVHLELKGISAHAMEPNNGKNAGLLLGQFLNNESLDINAKAFHSFVSTYFGLDTRGQALGIAFSDEISGELTVNCGIVSYHKQTGGRIGIDMRYPVTHAIDDSKTKIQAIAKLNHFRFIQLEDSKPHYLDEHSPLIQVLSRVYEQQTNEKAELIAIGGGTYARSLETGVAFGPLFPGKPDVAHQKDEYIDIDDLLRATAIYAQAIYELARTE